MGNNSEEKVFSHTVCNFGHAKARLTLHSRWAALAQVALPPWNVRCFPLRPLPHIPPTLPLRQQLLIPSYNTTLTTMPSCFPPSLHQQESQGAAFPLCHSGTGRLAVARVQLKCPASLKFPQQHCQQLQQLHTAELLKAIILAPDTASALLPLLSLPHNSARGCHPHGVAE